MSRFIDAEALKSCYTDSNGLDDKASYESIRKMIDNQPTAFDVDKVIEELNNNGQKMSEAKANTPYGKSTPGCHNYYKAISVKKASEIVRNGGVSHFKHKCANPASQEVIAELHKNIRHLEPMRSNESLLREAIETQDYDAVVKILDELVQAKPTSEQIEEWLFTMKPISQQEEKCDKADEQYER